MNESLNMTNMQKSLADRRLPLTVHEVVRLVNDSRTSVARLAAAVAKHQALAESVLRKANMSIYGLPGRVRNLNSAVVVLGFDALKETSRGVLVAHAGRTITNMVVQNQEIWEHSMGCAIIARFLALRSGKCDSDEAFLAGLLHDIGALFSAGQNQSSGGSPTGVLTTAQPVLEGMERFPHAHIGADMGRKWGLAEDVTEALRFHHFPRLATRNTSLTGVVHLAEFLCHQLHVGAAEYEEVNTVDPEVPARIGVAGISSAEAFMASFDNPDGDQSHRPSLLDQKVNNLKRKLFNALDELPEQQRLIVALHYFEGLSAAEIGLVLEIPFSFASAHLSDALSTLRNALKLST